MTAAGLGLVAFAGPGLAHDALPMMRPRAGRIPSLAARASTAARSPPGDQRAPDGYQISYTGEVVAYSDKRIKDSPDGEYHWCSVQGADDGKTICLFVPPPAY